MIAGLLVSLVGTSSGSKEKAAEPRRAPALQTGEKESRAGLPSAVSDEVVGELLT